MKTKMGLKFYTLITLFAVLITAIIFGVLNFVPNKTTAYAEDSVWQIENGVVISYSGNEETVVVPSEFNGLTTKKIGKNAFENNNTVKKVVLPDTITHILDRAFIYCKNLEEINFPQNLEEIQTWSFGYCYKLNNLNFPEGLKTIAPASFYGCKSITSAIIPDSLTVLGTHAFRGCESLNELKLSSSLKAISLRVFSGCVSLKEVEIPEGVKEIVSEAFYDCTGLKFVTFPSTLEKIGNHAFYNCKNVRAVDLKEGVTSIGERAFSGCNKILTINLPSTITEILKNAFDRCYKIKEVYNHSDLEIVAEDKDNNGGLGYYAKNVITQENYSSNVIYTEDGFVFYNENGVISLIDYQGELKDVVLPKTYNGNHYDVGEYAFYSISDVDTLTIHGDVKNIGYYAFYNCSSLREIRFDGTKGEWLEVIVDKGNSALEDVIFNVKWEAPNMDTNTNAKLGFFAKIWGGIKEFANSMVSNIFLVNFFVTIFFGALLIYTGNEESRGVRKKIFVIITCIQWILISGLRADSVGADTENYLNIFDEHAKMTWKETFNVVRQYFRGELHNDAINSELEPLFIVFNKLVSVFTLNHVVYKFVIAIIFTTALGSYVYKYSDDPCLSFIIYGGLFYNMFSLTGYRQVLAVAIILFGFRFIVERKFIPFLICLILGALFHKTTLIFILLYLLANKKITGKYLITVLSIFGIMLLFNRQIFELSKIIFGYEEYVGNYGFKQTTFTIMFIGITVLAVITYKPVLSENPNAVVYYNGLILAWLMFPFLLESPSTLRLVYNFLFVILPLMPLMMRNFVTDKEKAIIYILAFAVIGVSLLSNDFNYSFYFMS